MKLTKVQSGLLNNNTYILIDSGHGVIIDPGMNNHKLLEFIKANPIKYDYIILTHGHFDHVRMVVKAKELTGAKVAIHSQDEPLFKYELDRAKTPMEADVLLKDNDILTVENMQLHIMHTPGHSPGGICILCENYIFSGDTLFKGTVGRTDFWQGDYDTLMRSIDKLSALEGDYIVCTGHDENTTLNEERENNPYFKR